ncbi:hypothetical protein A3A56_03555 [Candidatus Roizmanbacteria bacterium RIFCSPLOWO2_01_FULL_40_32]|nr:MAG: hypothetical protein A3A56_03555 [Candidatus Roizmanbacteria bacterium RIFCSPLOWO2_01_FULL_40_32]
MKKLLFVLLFIIGFAISVGLGEKKSTKTEPVIVPTAASQTTLGPRSTSVFFPYWTIKDSEATAFTPKDSNREVDTAIYFGVEAQAAGINENEAGFESIGDFKSLTAQIPHHVLTIRMVNDEINSSVLESTSRQEKIINEALNTATKHGFDGILLDLEVGGLASTKLNTQIVSFTKLASELVRANGLTFDMTLYGDSFYRARPYSIDALSPFVDHFYVLAYDLHKLWGTPGPNFPMEGKDTFGYDMGTMVEDMSKFTSTDKLVVVFGLYGHDWIVDEKKRPLTSATTLTFSQIKEKFLDSCAWKNCLVKRDERAGELEINYIDEKLQYHIAWVEDTESVVRKIGFLKERGINAISFWAFGYY